MYLRIELADPADLDNSLKTLRALLPKPQYAYYPYKKMIGAEWYGFDLMRFDPLLDWKSIDTWCQLCSCTSAIDESCEILPKPTPEQVISVAPMVIDMIRKEREFSYEVEFYVKKYKNSFELTLTQEQKRLEVKFNFADFPSTDAKAAELLSRLWIQAAKDLGALKSVELELGKRVQFHVSEGKAKGVDIKATANELKLTYSSPAAIRAALLGALQFAVHSEPHFEFTRRMFNLRLFPDDAVKISQELSVAFGEPLVIYFGGAYREDFHPDQVLKSFPLEGYWQFPLFDLRGLKEFDSIPFFLVQTPKERFVEVFIDTEKHLKKVNDALKGKVKTQLHDGPTEKRWNLHKLKKKK